MSAGQDRPRVSAALSSNAPGEAEPLARQGGASLELFGTAACPYTGELREHLRWRRIPFTEYDVDTDASARTRLQALTGRSLSVPVLVEDGRVKEVGWRGRSCLIGVD